MIQVENLQNTIGSNDDKAKGLAEIIARYEQELNGRDAALSKTDDIIKMLRKSLDDLEFRNNEQAKRKRFRRIFKIQCSIIV